MPGKGGLPRVAAVSLVTGLASASLILATPGPATAATPATVRLSADSFGAAVSFGEGTGNVNNLRIFREGFKIAVTGGVPITATGGCASVSSTKALCDRSLSGREVRRVFIRLGDLNDTSSVEGNFSGQVLAEGGNDFLFAAQGTASMIYNGGPGSDTVSYQRSPVAVSVTKDDQNNDGAFGPFGSTARDSARDDVEQPVGDERPDTFHGLGGGDEISPGTNVDRVFGGGGSDTFAVRDSFVDFVDGGSGTDTATTDRLDSLTSIEALR